MFNSRTVFLQLLVAGIVAITSGARSASAGESRFGIQNGVPRPASSQAGTVTVLHSFGNVPDDGQYTQGGVTVDGAGDIFGTAEWGGSGDGILYELKPAGSSYIESILYDFGYPGSNPTGAPYEDAKGNIYVTNFYTGLQEFSPTGSGYVLTASGLMNSSVGYGSAASLLRDGQNYYTTGQFGAEYNYGSLVAFNVLNISQVTVAHNFAGGPSDGDQPTSTPVADRSGVMYGVTNVGGLSNLGTIYDYSPSTGSEQILWNFGGSDGANPVGSLLVGRAGKLYGTTEKGGKYGLGVVFELRRRGAEYELKILHTFRGPPDDGQFPIAGLTLVGDTLYGTSYTGGSNNDGTIFSLSTVGDAYTVLHDFEATDGLGPDGTLVVSNGALFGTTIEGGSAGARGLGVTFSYTSPALRERAMPSDR